MYNVSIFAGAGDDDLMNSVFLFGAGAEVCFNLPNGNDYARKTIFYNRKDSHDQQLKALFDRLKNYYQNDYYGHYFINSKNSIDIANQRKLLYFYLKSNKKGSKIKKFSEENQILCSFLNDADSKEFDQYVNLSENVKGYKQYLEIKQLFDKRELIGFDDNRNKVNYKYHVSREQCTNINFFELERLYHTVINPKKYGTRKYCQLINYYWCCFHLIYSQCAKTLLGYDTVDQLYGIGKGINFDVVRLNLEKMIVHVKYSKSKLEFYQNSYYYAVSQLFPDATVVTTNYSPYAYICHEPVFIHGNIWTFERGQIPELLTYDQISNNSKDLFPYLLCQSALKPIIHPLQIHSFQQMIDALNKADHLFVVGYGLSDDDHHISSIIKDYLKKHDHNKLIYISYHYDKLQIIEKQKELMTLFEVESSQIDVKNIDNKKDYQQFYTILKTYAADSNSNHISMQMAGSL